MTTSRSLVALTALLAISAADVEADTLSQAFTNDYNANAIYFFAGDSATLAFDSVGFAGGTAGWKVNLNKSGELVMSGPTVAPAQGLFTVTFDHATPSFAFEWAEVYFTATSSKLLGAGTLSWNGGWAATTTFTHLGALPAAGIVPIPPALIMLLSACGILPLIGRRRRG